MKKLFALLLALALALATLTVPALAENAPKAGKVKTVITLSHSGTVTLNVGDALQLTATVTPEAPVTWTTKKAKVATVDASGLVHAVAEGTATITAKAGGKSAKVKIKVVDPWKPTGVSIANGKAVTVGVGEAVQLTAVLAPATARATLAWTSKKPGIASVDGNGVVYGVAKGKTKVTVKAGKKKATVTVNVINPNEPTGIVLSHSGTVQLCENEQLQLYASLQPANAIGTVAWGSSKASVATVDGNGVVTAHMKGTATITAKVGKKKAEVKVKVVGAEQHQHTWQDVTENRYVVDSPAWDETVVDAQAWDETVVDSPESTEQIVHPEEGHYEDKVIVDKDAWDEKVWVENKIWIVDKPAGVIKTKEEEFVVCGCHLTFKSKAEYDAHVDYNRTVQRYYNGYFDQYPDMKAQIEAEYGNPPQYKVGAGGISQCGRYSNQTRDVDLPESEWVYQDEEGHYEDMGWYDVVHHDAETHTEKVWVVDKAEWTETIQVPAVTHVVHHDAVTHVVHHDEVGHWETVVVGQKCKTCGATK